MFRYLIVDIKTKTTIYATDSRTEWIRKFEEINKTKSVTRQAIYR